MDLLPIWEILRRVMGPGLKPIFSLRGCHRPVLGKMESTDLALVYRLSIYATLWNLQTLVVVEKNSETSSNQLLDEHLVRQWHLFGVSGIFLETFVMMLI